MRAAPTAATSTRGYDAGKKAQDRKRHIAVDTLGPLIAALVTLTSTSDRAAARSLSRRRLRSAAGRRVQLAWADGGNTETLLDRARKTPALTIEIVKRPGLPHFTVLPRRRVAKRPQTWNTNHHRCARDYEPLRHHHETMAR